ncbi:MAG: hypothetical protein KAU62_12225, partial [Candidatus Heimdallarchaeota archaeon]|nr:hypothetical protein [Candidatus Heimdallarchaeota archaeon]MCK4611915.1 hypothetical protein [Candidatus Heimdallarchaeota archaeon]
VVTGLFSPLMVIGAAATELSNPSRTPSLTGDVDYDYESDYRCDYVLKTEFPELSVLLFRLYYRMNTGSWNYATMSVLDSNTYKKDNFSPDDMGAIGGDEIDYYFYIKDSDNPAGEDTTATYSFTVNPDITPPIITNVVDDNDYNEPDNLVQFNATITDESGIDNATLYWSCDKITWAQETMSNIVGDIWSWTSSANDFSVGTLYYFVKAVDPSDNVMFSDSWSYDGSGNYYDWEEGSYEGWSTHSSYGSSSLTSTGEYKIDRDDAVDPNPHAAAWRIGFFSILNQSDYSVMVTRFKLESNGGYDDDEYIYYKSAGSFGITNSGTKSASYYADNIDSNAWHESVVYVADDSDWHDATSTLYLMMDSMNVSDSNQMYFDYCHILWARNFTVYDWDSPAVGTPTIVPSSDIENDDTVTISSTMTDEDSDVDSAGIYYHDGTSWGTEAMSEGASNVWSGDITAQTYDETIDYTVWGEDD